MSQVDKEEEIQKSIVHKIRVVIERKNLIKIEDEEESTSSSSMPMYNLHSNKEDSDMPSYQSPTMILQDDPLPMHLEEVHSSPFTKKVLFERN